MWAYGHVGIWSLVQMDPQDLLGLRQLFLKSQSHRNMQAPAALEVVQLCFYLCPFHVALADSSSSSPQGSSITVLLVIMKQEILKQAFLTRSCRKKIPVTAKKSKKRQNKMLSIEFRGFGFLMSPQTSLHFPQSENQNALLSNQIKYYIYLK